MNKMGELKAERKLFVLEYSRCCLSMIVQFILAKPEQVTERSGYRS